MPDIKQKAHEMFDERFGSLPDMIEIDIKSFIDEIIDMAVASREKEIIEDIKKNITDEFELSYQSDIDITNLPDELVAEMNGAKKAILGIRDFIISLISKLSAEALNIK